jgi:hypothetical protein
LQFFGPGRGGRKAFWEAFWCDRPARAVEIKASDLDGGLILALQQMLHEGL